MPGHILILRQARSPEEGLCQPGWMRTFCKSHSLMDPFMLILLMIKEGDPGVTCYKSPFACIFKWFCSKESCHRLLSPLVTWERNLKSRFKYTGFRILQSQGEIFANDAQKLAVYWRGAVLCGTAWKAAWEDWAEISPIEIGEGHPICS